MLDIMHKLKKTAHLVLKKITLNLTSIVLAFIILSMLVIYFTSKNNANKLATYRRQTEHNSIDDLFTEVVICQETGEYQAVINILKWANADKLALIEAKSKNPRFISIDFDGPVIYGIESKNPSKKNLNFITFPGTTDFISNNPGYDFWILWAINFTRDYNTRLESALKSPD